MAIKLGTYLNMVGTPRPGNQPVPVNPPPVVPAPLKEIQAAPTLSKPATLEPQKAPDLSQPGTLEFQPAPPITERSEIPLQSAPKLSTPTDPPMQPAPELGSPMAVQTEVSQKAPEITLRQPIPFQEAPELSTPAVMAFQPPPELSKPAPIAPFEPPPKLSATTPPPMQPAPPLTAPAIIPTQPAPELSTPAVIPFEPAPPLPTPAVIPFEPAPPLSTPAVIPFEPAPPLPTPAVIPFQPAPPLPTPAVISFQPAPPAQAPTVIPFQEAPVNPPIHDPTETDINKSYSNGLLDVHPPLQDMPAIDTTLFEGMVDKNTVTPAPGITPSAPASEQPSLVTEKVHAPTFAEERPYSNNLLDVHPGRQQMALGRQEKWSDRVDTQGGNLDLISSNVPAPFIGSFGFASLNPATLPNNLRLAAFTEAQILAARFGVQETINNAKNIITIGTKQQSTLIGMGMDFVNNAVFGSARGQSYHPVDGPSDVPDQPVDPKMQTLSMYSPEIVDNFDSLNPLDQSANTLPDSTPVQMDLVDLNDPDYASEENKKFGLANLWSRDSKNQINTPTANNKFSVKSDQLTSPFADPSARFFTNGAEETRGFFDVEAGNESARANSTPTDDETYMPLVFTDLRPLRGGHYRSVYFRPFIKSLSEELSPQWNMQHFFGRVDAVATYKSTDRKINLAFKVVAFSPEDLETIYQKIGWLTSMVYPEYRQSVYFAGPVIRMRVGDIINAVGREGNRGVPGVITSLNLNYDQSTWELLNGRRVPREIDVSMGFHVLHEYPIGLVQGVGGKKGDKFFGGIRPGGSETGNTKDSFVNVDRFRAIFGVDYLNDQKLQINSSWGKTESGIPDYQNNTGFEGI